jgi:hypothetical protein
MEAANQVHRGATRWAVGNYGSDGASGDTPAKMYG